MGGVDTTSDQSAAGAGEPALECDSAEAATGHDVRARSCHHDQPPRPVPGRPEELTVLRGGSGTLSQQHSAQGARRPPRAEEARRTQAPEGAPKRVGPEEGTTRADRRPTPSSGARQTQSASSLVIESPPDQHQPASRTLSQQLLAQCARRPPPAEEARQTRALEADRRPTPLSGARQTQSASGTARECAPSQRQPASRRGARELPFEALGQPASPSNDWARAATCPGSMPLAAAAEQRLVGSGGLGSNREGRSHKPPPGVAVCGPKLQAKAALAHETGTRPRVSESSSATSEVPPGSVGAGARRRLARKGPSASLGESETQ